MKEKILIIEDDGDVRKFLETELIENAAAKQWL